MNDNEFNKLKDCRYGMVLFNVNDQYIGKSLDNYGEYSEGEINIFRQLVRPGHTVIDVGAYIGTHTLFLSQAVGRDGKVIALEPQRIIFQTLCANMALNNLTNVICKNVALGNEENFVRVPILDPHLEQNFGSLELGSQKHGDLIQLVTLDSLSLENCNFIKIDVEGMEVPILGGAGQTINQFKPILYIENDRQEHSNDLMKLIASHEYRLYWHGPRLFNPDNFDGNPENIFGNIVSLNILCIHKSSPIEVDGAEPIVIPD